MRPGNGDNERIVHDQRILWRRTHIPRHAGDLAYCSPVWPPEIHPKKYLQHFPRCNPRISGLRSHSRPHLPKRTCRSRPCRNFNEESRRLQAPNRLAHGEAVGRLSKNRPSAFRRDTGAVTNAEGARGTLPPGPTGQLEIWLVRVMIRALLFHALRKAFPHPFRRARFDLTYRIGFCENDFRPLFCAEEDVDRVQAQSVRQWVIPPSNVLRLMSKPLCRA